MQALPPRGVVGVLLRDKGARRGARRTDGATDRPLRALRPPASRHLRAGIEGAAKVLSRRPAPSASTPRTGKLVETRDGDVETAACRDADAAGYGAGQIVLGSFHIMGSARMGGHPATAACDPTGQTYDITTSWSADGSTFPTSSGVNPQISIMAIAHMNASALAARLS